MFFSFRSSFIFTPSLYFLCSLLNLLPISFSPVSISLDAVPLPVSHRKSQSWVTVGVMQGQLMALRLMQYTSVQQHLEGPPPNPRELGNIVTVLTELLQSHTPPSLWWTYHADWALLFVLWGAVVQFLFAVDKKSVCMNDGDSNASFWVCVMFACLMPTLLYSLSH